MRNVPRPFRAVARTTCCAALLSSCVAYGPNRQHVMIEREAVLPSMVGHHVKCVLVDLLAAPGSEQIGGGFVEPENTTDSPLTAIFDTSGSSLGEWIPGVMYGLEVMVDMNDNNSAPEPGIDYTTSPVRLEVQLDARPDGTVFVIYHFVLSP